MKILIKDISDFKGHPFHASMNQEMARLIDSIESNGLMVPVIVRPKKDGIGYEMIAGHRRKFALENLNIVEVDAIVRNVDNDQDTILMVDSNIQREDILPTERGKAYSMRLEAMKHQGKRMDLTCGQVDHKLTYKKKYIDALAELVGENRKQVQRYIRLTQLIEPLQKMVDGLDSDGYKIAFLPTYELSSLSKDEQEMLYEAIITNIATPSLSQAQELKRKSQSERLEDDDIQEILSKEKPNQREKLHAKTKT